LSKTTIDILPEQAEWDRQDAARVELADKWLPKTIGMWIQRIPVEAEIETHTVLELDLRESPSKIGAFFTAIADRKLTITRALIFPSKWRLYLYVN